MFPHKAFRIAEKENTVYIFPTLVSRLSGLRFRMSSAQHGGHINRNTRYGRNARALYIHSDCIRATFVCGDVEERG